MFLSKKFFVISMFYILATQSVQADWILKRSRLNNTVTPLGAVWLESENTFTTDLIGIQLKPKAHVVKSIPMFLSEDSKPSSELYEEVYFPGAKLPPEYEHINNVMSDLQIQGLEVRKIFDQGPDKNRICLTFLGDGYTEAEKEKFYEDVQRLFDDIALGNTFASYRNLFNVYAIFVPSQDSGITDTQKKNTAFGLYRSPAGSKRGIMPGKTFAIETALKNVPKTDYPIIIANDDFYGGLGGRYAITTRSEQTGKIVLRHELGHNFGDVGEEYDNGQVYSGANSSRSSQNLPWKHWVEPTTTKIANEMKLLSGAYVWKNLNQGSVVQNFVMPQPRSGQPFSFDLVISSVGWETPQDVEVLLDGQPLLLEGVFTDDRSFFRLNKPIQLNPGSHQIEIKEQIKDNNNILAFATLFAYEPEYNFSGAVGAFTTYDEGGSISYRPTHGHCIMRDMAYEYFCAIDQENMWLRFLDRVSLIDQLVINSQMVKLEILQIEDLYVKWSSFQQDGWVELPQFSNQTQLPLLDLGKGKFKVEVQMKSPEIRLNKPRLKQVKEFTI